MNSPQVSIWVPIAVGIIGLVGVISGQLVNAWREDRRWRREVEREELRWMREQDREKDSIRREKRFECYSQLAILLSRWFELFVGQGSHFDNVANEFESQLLELQRESDRIYGLIRLLGSEAMSEIAFNSIDALKSNNHLFFNGELRDPGKCDGDEYQRNLDEATVAINYARAELGFASNE